MVPGWAGKQQLETNDTRTECSLRPKIENCCDKGRSLAMRILIMGGTRFIGVYLTRLLVEQGHEVTLFNRGNKPAPVEGVKEIHGDRTNPSDLKDKLSTQEFDAIFDNNGRELSDTQPLAEIFRGRIQHFVYMSSAGVYLKSDQMPHIEGDAVDPKSRHKGKNDTETYLAEQGIPFTSIRPTYIYGPQNYNDLEAWFFDRLVRDRTIPIPGHGQHFPQFGHVHDLAIAMTKVLGNSNAIGQIYNISGEKAVTFDGLARACAEAAGKDPSALKSCITTRNSLTSARRRRFRCELSTSSQTFTKPKLN